MTSLIYVRGPFCDDDEGNQYVSIRCLRWPGIFDREPEGCWRSTGSFTVRPGEAMPTPADVMAKIEALTTDNPTALAKGRVPGTGLWSRHGDGILCPPCSDNPARYFPL